MLVVVAVELSTEEPLAQAGLVVEVLAKIQMPTAIVEPLT
jgi:hypothetical protein